MHAKMVGIVGRKATLTIGVDMGTCMAECNAGALLSGVNYQNAGAGLLIFFKRLTEFLKAPVALVFVLDGPTRPAFKCGHTVQHQPKNLQVKPLGWHLPANAVLVNGDETEGRIIFASIVDMSASIEKSSEVAFNPPSLSS
ncbi:hypothetical protein BDN70DRAFT_985788 [Pholiota conissans]|uniref:Uncharacterized protein n=1 Tax=Pholiota conissans TaxID=109636 RepID=A0A9P6CRQ4_9AGAR|nr:hypothetical protein BDN70DRAFT_985788 [Pholiota conissans]